MAAVAENNSVGITAKVVEREKALQTLCMKYACKMCTLSKIKEITKALSKRALGSKTGNNKNWTLEQDNIDNKFLQ